MELPIPAGVPPQLPVYHTQVALEPNPPPTTERLVVNPLQIVVVPEMPLAAEEKVFTFTVCTFDTAGLGLHPEPLQE